MAGIVAPAWRRNNAPDYGSTFRATTDAAAPESGMALDCSCCNYARASEVSRPGLYFAASRISSALSLAFLSGLAAVVVNSLTSALFNPLAAVKMSISLSTSCPLI